MVQWTLSMKYLNNKTTCVLETSRNFQNSVGRGVTRDKWGVPFVHELLTKMAFNKQQYESLPGKDGGNPPVIMASEKPPIVNQPAKLSPTEEYVLNLDPATVSGEFEFLFV